MVYLEVHGPSEDFAAVDLEKIYTKLMYVEKETEHTIDWKKVKEVLAEARGIPVPIFEIRQGIETGIPQIVEIKHPDKLYGKPEVPELKVDAWYVLAANMNDKLDAARLAAIIRHQGPPIPATVLSVSDRHRVMAGPFNDIIEARKAIKRLKIDLEIDGILVEPARK
jgi:L,D-transpeptidase ErfK/SrfK